jgi:hypothetical protein
MNETMSRYRGIIKPTVFPAFDTPTRTRDPPHSTWSFKETLILLLQLSLPSLSMMQTRTVSDRGSSVNDS